MVEGKLYRICRAA